MNYSMSCGVRIALIACLLSGCAGSAVTPPPAHPAPPTVPAPAKAGREKTTEFQMGGAGLILPNPIVFQPGSAVLGPANNESLLVVVDFLEARPDVTLLRIEAHLEGDGEISSAQEITEHQALSVARWLVARGVDCRQLLPVGFGDSKPIAPNDSPENKAKNRRILFKPASLNGRPPGVPIDGGGKIAGDPCN